jgi:threonine/homoserine/homoserine lactone efflux protein
MDIAEPFAFLARGFVLGLSIAAPVGPIALLCIQRSLSSGPAAGFAAGLGAATADACYGALAAFGVGIAASVLAGIALPLKLVGGAVLAWLGIQTWRSKPADRAAAAPAGLARGFATVFGLTLTNPMTILSFAAAFGGLGLAGAATQTSAPALVIGVFLGSAAWWLALALVVGGLGRRLSPRALRAINGVSGAILVAFGLAAIGLGLADLGSGGATAPISGGSG